MSFLKKLSPTHTHPLISIHEFLKPYKLLFLEFESFVKVWMWIGKNSLNNFICHLSFLNKLSPLNPLLSIHEMKPFELKNSLNNFMCHLSFLKKLHSIILCFTCHSLRYWYTSPLIHSWNFETLLLFLRKLFPTHTHPLVSIHEILKPYELYFQFESFIKVWMWIGKKFTQ